MPVSSARTSRWAKDVVNAGYITLKLAKESWVMKPVLSSTGAIRLEDVKGQTLLLQILTKSMLMNVKAGKRVVDGCVHDTQRAAEEHLREKTHSPPTCEEMPRPPHGRARLPWAIKGHPSPRGLLAPVLHRECRDRLCCVDRQCPLPGPRDDRGRGKARGGH